jgi:S1-C subfamily serine protease
MAAYQLTSYTTALNILGPTGGIVGTISANGDKISIPNLDGLTGPTGPTGPNVAYNAVSVYSDVVSSLTTLTIRSATNAIYGGSGFFVNLTGSSNYNPSSYGYLATAAHVVIDPSTNAVCSSIWVFTNYPENSTIQINSTDAVVMGVDKIADVALLRIAGSHWKPMEIVSSRSLHIGEPINVMGFPLLEDAQSITRGIVRDNKYQDANVPESLLTDASIYGGNSGGPVATDEGKAVGILSWSLTDYEEMNGAVGSHLFKPIIEYIADNYSNTLVDYPKGYLGILYTNVGVVDIMNYPSLNKIEGIRVTGLDPAVSPARFSTNDIITEVEDVRVGQLNSQYPFFTEIHLRRPTSTISVKYKPWDSGTANYLSETTKTVELTVFNPSRDVLFSNARYHPIPG